MHAREACASRCWTSSRLEREMPLSTGTLYRNSLMKSELCGCFRDETRDPHQDPLMKRMTYTQVEIIYVSANSHYFSTSESAATDCKALFATVAFRVPRGCAWLFWYVCWDVRCIWESRRSTRLSNPTMVLQCGVVRECYALKKARCSTDNTKQIGGIPAKQSTKSLDGTSQP